MGNSEDDLDLQKDSMENTFEKRFGWYVVLNRVTGNVLKDHDKALEKNVIEVLNQLYYLIEYDKEQERMIKKAQQRG